MKKVFDNQRIVVPFDFSNESIAAAKLAVNLAEQINDVHVAHVLLEFPSTDPVAGWSELDDARRKEHARENMRQQLADNDIEGVHLNVTIGRPARVIADLAEEIQAGLIVVPSNKDGGYRRWFLGSVAERIVQLAKCPVLVLKV